MEKLKKTGYQAKANQLLSKHYIENNKEKCNEI